jgi:hypothetical protein
MALRPLATLLGMTLGCRATTATPPPPPEVAHVAAATVDAGAADGPLAPTPALEPDQDHDAIIDRCDGCPAEAEVYQGILDEDGCPDDSGTAHAVMHHPTHEYARPFGVRPGTTTMERDDDDLDWLLARRGVQELACVAHVPAGTRSARTLRAARARAAKACVALAARATYEIATRALATPSDELLGPFAWADVDLAVVVTRAEGVEVWRWTGADFERSAPIAELPVWQPLPGCP